MPTMKKTNKMTLNDLLTMTFTEETYDHMRDLRERLYNKGLISTPNKPTCTPKKRSAKRLHGMPNR